MSKLSDMEIPELEAITMNIRCKILSNKYKTETLKVVSRKNSHNVKHDMKRMAKIYFVTWMSSAISITAYCLHFAILIILLIWST